MAREYRPRPADVVASRLDLADARPAKPVDAGHNRALALLAISPEEMDRLDGRRAVARYSMLNAHGCEGKRCRDAAAHWRDIGVRDELLAVLGLGGEPG